jgi:O-antigen ligase
VEAIAASPRTEASLKRLRPVELAAAVIAIIVASWLPVLVGATTRTAFGWLAAVALALIVERLTRDLIPGALVAGLLLSSALVPSGLVTDATHYMPVAVTGGALAIRAGFETWRTRRLNVLTPRPVVIALGLYLAWAALTTVTSIDHRVSAFYLAGMIGICALAFWAIPAMMDDRSSSDAMLAALSAVGVVVALTVYVVAFVGNLNIFGRPVGLYQLADLTVGGQATGLFFGRSSGVYLAPLEPSILMVIAVGALLGWSATRRGRPLLLARLALVFIAPAILLTLDRTAWLAAIVATGAFAVLAPAARLKAVTATVLFWFFALSFLLVLSNVVGANAVAPACTAGCAPGTGETTLRGGTGLSDREHLWRASLYAIQERPLLGFGPGNDVPAIDPYLDRAGAPTHGLTSHSTWLRTAVEMGVPGLALLIGVLGAVAWRVVRRLRETIGEADAFQLALVASVFGLVPAMTFESFLLGGVAFSSLYLTLALGLIAAAQPVRHAPA